MSKPKIFISWSGKDTASFRVASKLYDIMPLMFQNADFFFSDHITKGKLAIDKIFSNLAEAKIGIFCVTKNNILKPWLNFEAGAIASAVTNNDGLAIPLLINMNTDDFASFSSPISHLEGTVFTDENDLLRMIQDIRRSINSSLSEKQLDNLFDTYKTKIYDCDITDESLNSVGNGSPVISAQLDTSMTKDCKDFLRLLYIEYLCSRKMGKTIHKATHFNTSEDVSNLLNIPLDDVEYFTYQLGRMDFLNYKADKTIISIALTEKGIKYGEDNFDEPSYITALRIIFFTYYNIEKEILIRKGLGISGYDIDILKDKQYIQVIRHLTNGDYIIRLTARAFEFGIKERMI